MATTGPSRQLEGFVNEVTALVASGDAESFRRCAGPLERLLRSGFVPAFVVAELERAADEPEYEPMAIDGAGLALVRAPTFSLGLSVIEPTSVGPGGRADGLTGHLAVGVLGPSALEIERYHMRPPPRWDVLDRSLRLDGPCHETLETGDAGVFAAGEDVVRMAAREGATAVLELRSAPVHRIRWVYDLATRAPILAAAAEPRSSRIEFACRLLARLGAACDVPALEDVTAHPDHFVRWTALQSIVALDLARGRELIEAARDDPHPHIRSAAGRFLREVGPALVAQEA